MNNTFLKNLTWRFATKKFDPEKKVSNKDIQKILQAIQFAPSSYGLQPYHILVITDQKIKKQIKKYAYAQNQVTDCSHLLVFCARTDIKDRIKQYVELASTGDPIKKNNLQHFKLTTTLAIGKLKDEKALAWTAKQTYLALGFALAAAAELKIDSSPMEGFMPQQIDKILKLPAFKKSVALLALGYRKDRPTHPKFRYPKDDLFSIK